MALRNEGEGGVVVEGEGDVALWDLDHWPPEPSTIKVRTEEFPSGPHTLMSNQ
jgi:hypothetical protein